MFRLTYENLPRVYSLETDGESISIIVEGCYRERLDKTFALSWFSDQEKHMMKRERLLPFERSIGQGPWGFGGIIDSTIREDRLVFRAPIQEIRKASTGSYDWNRSFHVSHSIQILLEFLFAAKSDYPVHGWQMFGVRLVTWEGMHGGSISADVSPMMVAWLVKDFDEVLQSEVEKVMAVVHTRMCPGQSARGMRCYMNHETLHMNSAANGSLGVNGCVKAEPGQGFELSPHNCDTALDQLVFLAALAKIEMLFLERHR